MGLPWRSEKCRPTGGPAAATPRLAARRNVFSLTYGVKVNEIGFVQRGSRGTELDLDHWLLEHWVRAIPGSGSNNGVTRMGRPSIIGLITARGGSKGLPGKNLAPLAGRPLICWTIEAALDSLGLGHVIVSTDDREIARISQDAGADVPFFRPAELAEDDSPHILAVDHAIRWLVEHRGSCPEYVMLLQPTSPLRTADDIDASIDLALERGADAVVSVCEAKQHPAKTYGIGPDRTLTPFVSSDMPNKRRQDLPPAFTENGAIYLNRCASLDQDRSFIPPGTVPYVMPASRSLDIDSEWDLFLADLVLRHSANRSTKHTDARR